MLLSFLLVHIIVSASSENNESTGDNTTCKSANESKWAANDAREIAENRLGILRILKIFGLEEIVEEDKEVQEVKSEPRKSMMCSGLGSQEVLMLDISANATPIMDNLDEQQNMAQPICMSNALQNESLANAVASEAFENHNFKARKLYISNSTIGTYINSDKNE